MLGRADHTPGARWGSSMAGVDAQRVLFVHGGPGFTAELERRRYAASLPVHWWDQPRVLATAPKAYEKLIQAAVAELKRLSDRNGAPVALLVSSFGTYLACELLRRAAERVESVTISGGVFDSRLPFVRLGRYLARCKSDQAIAEASRAAEDPTDPAGIWTLIGRIAATPGFYDHYWAPGAHEQRAAMRVLAAEGPMFDPATFEAVMNKLLSFGALAAPNGESRPTRVLLGRYDPLVDEADPSIWRVLFPSALIEVVDCGHFPHLELPPSAWMPD